VRSGRDFNGVIDAQLIVLSCGDRPKQRQWLLAESVGAACSCQLLT
jgi:hypothetical protein